MWKRYESIVNTSRELLTLIGSDYRYEAANDAFCQAQGRSREEIINSSVADVWGKPTFVTAIQRYLEQCFAGEEVHCQAWFDMPALGRRFFDVSYYPYRQKGVVTHAIVVTRDVTERQQAEVALRESEEQFRTLMQSAIDAIVLADSRGSIIAWNQGARTIFGRTDKEVLGRPVSMLMPERYRRAHELGIHRVNAGGEANLIGKTVELHGIRKDGSEFPLELSLASWRTASGRFYCGIMRDITRRKRAEEEIRLLQTISLSVSEAEDMQAALKAVVHNVCDATGWVFGQAWIPRRDGSGLECGPAWHTNRPGLKEFKRANKTFLSSPGIGLPGRVWTSRQAVWIRDVTREPDFVRAPVAQKAGLRSALAMPIMAGDQVVAVIEFFVCETRQEDERLIKLVSAVANNVGIGLQRKWIEEQFDRFFTISLDLLCMVGFDGYLKRVNPAWERVLGQSTEELLAAPLVELAHPDDRGVLTGLERLRAGATMQSFELRIRARDGSYRWIQWTATPVHNERLLYAIGRDITENKQAEEALRKNEEHYRVLFNEAKAMQEKLRELSSKILHAQEEERKHMSRELHDEVGQALTAISVNLQLLKKKAARTSTDLNQSIAETQNLLEQTMYNVHRFSYELRPAMLDDLGLVVALRWYIRAFVKRTSIKVSLRADRTVEKLASEPKTVIYRIVQESLTNVYKYAQAGRVKISIRKVASAVRLAVQDDGKGFDPDRQCSGPADKSGLGLMGMQERLRLVNGEFAVRSAPGKGTTILASIPLKLGLEKPRSSGRLNHAKNIRITRR
jgi:PAS domain S-box-containing protein